MADPDVHSLAKQIRFVYADNMHSQHPMRLALSSLRERGRRDGGDEGEVEDVDGVGRLHECLHRNAGFHNWAMLTSPLHFLHLPPSSPPSPPSSPSPPSPSPSPLSSFVYLTAESPHLLTSLDPSLTYIIGGLVDHNRLKGHCEAEAQRLGVRTARLGIGECMEIEGGIGRRTVITVNQVFACLLEWWQGERSRREGSKGEEEGGGGGGEGEEWQYRWGEVFEKVLPRRGGWRVKAEWRRKDSHQQPDESADGPNHETTLMPADAHGEPTQNEAVPIQTDDV